MDNKKTLGTKKWTELMPDEKNNIVEHYRGNGRFRTEVLSTMSGILFNWLFILNSGGLLSIVTIFASSPNKTDIKFLCFKMGLCFLIGLSCVYLAVRLEHCRFHRIGNALDESFTKLQEEQITVEQYINESNEGNILYRVINILEYLSFILFFTGTILGFLAIHQH